jgi:acetyltransferase
MSQHCLTSLFALRLIAIIGASNKPDSGGWVIFRNMLEDGFQGGL